jgi:Holliday junction resolvase RusA-like endonuclease
MDKIWFDIEPVPAPRARTGRYGQYYPPKYKKFQRDMASEIGTLRWGTPLKGPIAVEIKLVCTQPKNPTRSYPCRGDIDNYSKGVLDALNGIAWVDDVQVTSLEVTKEYAPKTERGSIQIIYGPAT